ncbi:MAG: serine hydrolase [Rhodoferax sp.]|nr:serine hydrolase [Rhodoferax sp.]
MLLLAAGPGSAAPDENSLGKAWGYPVAPRLAQAFQEGYRVGSFSAMDSLGPHCVLEPSATPLPLPRAASEPAFRYSYEGRSYTLDDYMQRQRATVLLVLKDGEIVSERSNYDRTPAHRHLSNSMAKTIVALAVGKALEEKRIRSLDDTAADYEPRLAGTVYGRTKILHLLRMASGARFVEDYSGSDDLARFSRIAQRNGTAAAAAEIRQMASEPGSTFNYASAETQMLGLVLRAATGESLCAYVGSRIWQPMGAQSRATWLTNPADGIEMSSGYFNATAHDYARLGLLMARDGLAGERSVVPRDWLLQMTDPAMQPEAFRPGRMQNKGSTSLGYGFQTWILPGSTRRFALLGVHGQAIYVDPALKLVVVHLAVARDASGDASGTHMAAERNALLRGIVGTYGRW